MQEARFERLGMFPFSPEPKTPAERMDNQVPEKVKQERLHRLMTLQQEISEEINRQWLGREVEVLIDEEVPSAKRAKLSLAGTVSSNGFSWFLGRTYADAPEVDGQVFVRSAELLSPGQFVRAKITDTYEYDLVAESIPHH